MSFWKKGQPRPKATPHALPVFTVDSEDDAESLITLVARVHPADGRKFLSPTIVDFEQDVTKLDLVTNKLAAIYEMQKEKRRG